MESGHRSERWGGARSVTLPWQQLGRAFYWVIEDKVDDAHVLKAWRFSYRGNGRRRHGYVQQFRDRQRIVDGRPVQFTCAREVGLGNTIFSR